MLLYLHVCILCFLGSSQCGWMAVPLDQLCLFNFTSHGSSGGLAHFGDSLSIITHLLPNHPVSKLRN